MPESLTVFGPYKVVRTLARGGMAEIFIARKEGPAGFAKTVVVKRILPEHSGNDEFVQMFRDEARLAAQLEHPNIVHITDFGEVQGTYYLAMEYLQGQELGQLLRARLKSRQGPFPPAVAAFIGAQACAGLHYAHTFADELGKPLRIVHRDISPSNIFVTFQGAVKVLDFGIAKAEGKLTQTRAGMVKGKLLYMSPEQTWAKVLDGRSDVWALGVVLYELLTGQRAFFRAGEDDSRVMNERLTMVAIDQEKPKRIRELVPTVPGALDDIVFKCIEKDPSRRWQTAAELRRALDGFLQSQQVHGTLLAEFMETTLGAEQIRELTQPTPAQQPARGEQPPPPPQPTMESRLEPIDLSLQTRAAQRPVDEQAEVETTYKAVPEVPEPTRADERAHEAHESSLHRPNRGVLIGIALAALALVGVVGFTLINSDESKSHQEEEGPFRATIKKSQHSSVLVDAGDRVDAGMLHVAAVIPVGQETTDDAGALATIDTVLLHEHEHEHEHDAGAPSPSSTRDAGVRLAKSPRTTPVKNDPPESPQPPPAPAKATGIVKVSCAPWGAVFVDAVERGMASPVLSVEVTTGPHTIECRHPELGTPKSSVSVGEGQTVSKTLAY